jgi:hypothetical protein
MVDSVIDTTVSLPLPQYKFTRSRQQILMHYQYEELIITGLFRAELSFFDRVDRGARVTRVTMPTARYLALEKFY